MKARRIGLEPLLQTTSADRQWLAEHQLVNESQNIQANKVSQYALAPTVLGQLLADEVPVVLEVVEPLVNLKSPPATQELPDISHQG